MRLRDGREHRARQPGRAKSRSERAAARLRHRHHTARCAEHIGVARGAQWMERERREARRGPVPLPGSWGRARPEADPRKWEAKRGEGKRGVAAASGAEQERQKSMQEGAEEGRGGEAPPGAAGPGGRSDAPALWASSRWLAPGVGPSSHLLHAASLAQRVQPGRVPGSPQPRAPVFLAFPGGGG